MLCWSPACSLRWKVPGIHCQEKHGYLQTLEINTKDPFSVKPNGQSRLQISLEKRDHSIAEDDSRPLLPLFDAPVELPTNSSTAEDSRASWKNTLLDKLLSRPDQSLKQLEQVEGGHLCCSHLGLPAWGYFHGIHLYLSNRNTASLPERLSEWKLKVPFPHLRILKKPPQIKMFIFTTLSNVLHYFLLLPPE